MINVLVADDSLTFRKMLTELINRADGMQVIATAENGEEAMLLAKKMHPDLITMDVNMPEINGIQATRQIMASHPCPILIVSEYRYESNDDHVFEAMEAGALAVVNKPSSPNSDSFDEQISWLIRNIRVLSEVKVVTRKPTPANRASKPVPPAMESKSSTCSHSGAVSSASLDSDVDRLVLIGASTGGPMALQQLLSGLSPSYKYPIGIVQHIAGGFVSGLVDWLQKTTHRPVKVAQEGERMLPGYVYFAPDKMQMGIDRFLRCRLHDAPPEHGMKPSVGYLFRNASVHHAKKTIAILMTGMGSDGALELLGLKNSGAFTIAQDKASSIVHGMPGEAIKLGAVDKVLNPEQIASLLNHLAGKSNKS